MRLFSGSSKASAGRPRREDVTEAVRLEADDVKRQEIYCRLGKTTRDQQQASIVTC